MGHENLFPVLEPHHIRHFQKLLSKALSLTQIEILLHEEHSSVLRNLLEPLGLGFCEIHAMLSQPFEY